MYKSYGNCEYCGTEVSISDDHHTSNDLERICVSCWLSNPLYVCTCSSDRIADLIPGLATSLRNGTFIG